MVRNINNINRIQTDKLSDKADPQEEFEKKSGSAPKLLADLKKRELILNRLLKEGSKRNEASKLHNELVKTIEDLELLLSSSDIDALSGEDLG